MKKLKNLTFACLLILGLAACADDDKSSDNPPVTNTNETVTLEFTGEIGKENVNTITLTNPHGTDADLNGYFYNADSSIKIDTANSTCKIIENYSSYNITSKLAAGESCEIKYTFKPAKLDTILLKLQVNYTRTFESYCPTPDTVPSYETIITNNKDVDMYIYNYAKDSSGTTSPEYINVEIPAEWSVSVYMIGNNTEFNSYSQDFNLPAEKGEYSASIYSGTLQSNDNNCSISNDSYNNYTLSVINNKGCSLKVTATAGYVSPIKFSPKQEGNPYYNVNVDVNSKYQYSIVNPNSNYSGFYPAYYATSSGNTDFYAGILKNGEKITSYEITGTNKDKFKVAGTMHNSCTVTDTEISIPEGQENCFFTVELADISESGNWTAELKTNLSNGSSNIYQIDGTVSKTPIEEILQNVCKNNTQNNVDNKAYKLF